MKILNLEEFRKMPEGTLFMKYEPCVFGDLQAKDETWKHDFLTQNITYWPDCTGSGDFSDKLFSAQETGESILMDFDSTGRDGCFDKDQLFAVYDKRDIEMLMDKLERCKASAYPWPKQTEQALSRIGKQPTIPVGYFQARQERSE